MNSDAAQVFVGTIVHTPSLGSLEILHDHVLVLDPKGFIAELLPRDKAASYLALPSVTTLPAGCFLLPSFVDLHLHAPQYLYLGNGLHLPLMQWLDQYAFKAEERLDNDPILAKRVYEKLALRLKEGGTGAVLLFGTIKEETNLILAEAFQQAGLRGFVGKLSMDQSTRPTYVESSTSTSLASAKSFIDRCRSLTQNIPSHERLVEPVLTPRFVPTCTDELLNGLAHMSREEHVRVQSHLAEARDQVDWVKSTRNADDIDVFDKATLLSPLTTHAHCTFLSPPSLSHLSKKGTSIAHCPLSNAYFSSLPFPLREALDLGVKVGLGTDVAGGYSVDIMNAMRQAVAVSRMRQGALIESSLGEEVKKKAVDVDWKEAIYIATRGGANALGLSSGVFKIGAPFDAQLIQLLDADGTGLGVLDFFDPTPEALPEDVIEKWWCLGDQRNRKGLWVQGKKIL